MLSVRPYLAIPMEGPADQLPVSETGALIIMLVYFVPSDFLNPTLQTVLDECVPKKE